MFGVSWWETESRLQQGMTAHWPLGKTKSPERGGMPILWSSAASSHGARVSVPFPGIEQGHSSSKGFFRYPNAPASRTRAQTFLSSKGGHEDNRRDVTLGNQLCLKVCTAHAWHLNIGNQARRSSHAHSSVDNLPPRRTLRLHIPSDRTRLLTALRTSSSSSTIEITGISTNLCPNQVNSRGCRRSLNNYRCVVLTHQFARKTVLGYRFLGSVRRTPKASAIRTSSATDFAPIFRITLPR